MVSLRRRLPGSGVLSHLGSVDIWRAETCLSESLVTQAALTDGPGDIEGLAAWYFYEHRFHAAVTLFAH